MCMIILLPKVSQITLLVEIVWSSNQHLLQCSKVKVAH